MRFPLFIKGLTSHLSKNNIILYCIVSVVGVALCVAFSMQQTMLWIGLLGISAIVPFTYLSIRYPDFIIFVTIIVTYSVNNRYVVVIILMALVLFLKNIIFKRLVRPIDTVMALWIGLLFLTVITIPRWTNIKEALHSSLFLLIMPMSLHYIINYGYFSFNACKRIFIYYFPLIHMYIVCQFIFVVVSGVATTGINLMKYHSGFNLGWGTSVFIAAVLLFFTILEVRTAIFWWSNVFIRIAVIFNIIVSIIGIIVIMARASVVSLVAALVFYFVFSKVYLKKGFRINISYIILGVFAAIISTVFLHDFINLLAKRFIYMKHDASFILRIQFYIDGIRVFLNNMIIGVGPHQHSYQATYSIMTDPNNIFLDYAVCFGLGGLIIISILFLWPYIMVYRINKVKNNKYIGMLLLPVITLAFFNSCLDVIITSNQYGLFFWTLYATFYRVYKHEVKDS